MTNPVTTGATPHNGFGITALVLGITGLVFGLVPLTGFLALILGALAVVFGLLGLARARRGEATNQRMATVSSVLGVAVAALGIWGITITFNAVDQFGKNLQGIGNPAEVSAPTLREIPGYTIRNGIYVADPTFPAVSSQLPEPSDFTIAVKVMAKQCFGSAGCIVTYRIVPTYTGASSISGSPLTVVYEVSGGKDGPQINNFTTDGAGSASFPRSEFIQTSSPATVLTARATSISKN